MKNKYILELIVVKPKYSIERFKYNKYNLALYEFNKQCRFTWNLITSYKRIKVKSSLIVVIKLKKGNEVKHYAVYENTIR